MKSRKKYRVKFKGIFIICFAFIILTIFILLFNRKKDILMIDLYDA